jgi:hypothetical protein
MISRGKINEIQTNDLNEMLFIRFELKLTEVLNNSSSKHSSRDAE